MTEPNDVEIIKASTDIPIVVEYSTSSTCTSQNVPTTTTKQDTKRKGKVIFSFNSKIIDTDLYFNKKTFYALETKLCKSYVFAVICQLLFAQGKIYATRFALSRELTEIKTIF